MSQVIEVNGELIEFPEGMSDAEIAKAIKTATTPQNAPITSGFRMGLKDPISGGAQLLPRGLEFLSSAGGLVPNRLSEFFGSEAKRVDEMVKSEEQAYQQSRQAQGESGFDWSRLGGNIVNPANLIGIRAATGVAKGAKPVVFAAGVGAAQGGLQPVYNTDDFETQKLIQTGAGAVGGVAGKKIAEVAGGMANPLVSRAEQTMRDLGVTMTPGQMLGRQPKALEEFAQNMPLIGSYISNAKERQLFQFNQGVINKALGKIDAKLPADVIGRDAVAAANDIVGRQYDDVLSKINFNLDNKTTAAIGNVVKTSQLPSAAQKQELNDLVNVFIYQKIPVSAPRKGGTIDGPAFKAIESDLLKKVQQLRSSSTAAERSMGDELGRVLDVFKTSMKAQNPKQSSTLRRIDSAYGDLAVMRTAAANSGAENGVFTPKQYQTAVRQRDMTRSKSAFAAGQARGQDVSDSAMTMLNPEVGSTLEGRLALGATGAYGALQVPEVMGTLAVATPAMYSQQGLKVMEALMRSRPEVARRIGAKLTERASKEGSITGAEIMEEYNRATRIQPR